MSGSLVTMQIEGADALEQALRDLGSDRDIRLVMKKALILAGEPMAKEARSLAPHRSGQMAEGIDVSVQLSRRQRGTSNSSVGPDGAIAYVGAAPVGPAVLIEFGTAKRNWKNGKSTGHTPAHPFMRPAFESTKFAMLKIFSDALWVGIAAAAEKIRRRQERALRK
jgi:HK97 gp10 family phage protein